MSFMRRAILFFATLLLFVFGLLFAIGNADTVSIVFLSFESVYLPVFAWLIGAFVIGVLIGALGCFFSTRRSKSK